MPVDDVSAAGKENRAKKLQGIPFKPRGLKGRGLSDNSEPISAIVDDTHTYEDLCFLKQKLEYYIGLMRKQGAREKHVKDLFDSIEKINKKLEKAIGSAPFKKGVPNQYPGDIMRSHDMKN